MRGRLNKSQAGMLHRHTARYSADYAEGLYQFYLLLRNLESQGKRVWPVRRGREGELLDVLNRAAADTAKDGREDERADKLVKLLLESS